MKHLHFLFMLLILMVGIQHSYGAIGKAQIADNYYCGFNTQEEFNQWTVIMADNDDAERTWQWNSGGYVECISDQTMISNDWLISPLLTLSGNKSHFIKLKLVDEGRYGQPVAFTMGKDKTVAGQTEILLDTIIPGYSTGYAVIKIPATIEPGDYYFGIRYKGDKGKGWFDLHSFYLTESAGVTLNGVVSNSKDKILSGAEVSLSGDKYKEMVCKTDATGNYSFSGIDAGEYHLKVKADGNIAVEETITVGGSADMNHPIVMQALINFDVTGRVLSEGNTPVKSALVTLKGELSYSVLTDDKGNFVIEDAREYNAYQLKIEKDLKATYTAVVTVSDAVVKLGDIVMPTRVSDPANVKVQDIDAGAALSWMLPLKETEIRYDSGILGGYYSTTGGENPVSGTLFDFPVVVKGMKWMAAPEDTPTSLVDLYVFAVNRDGLISSKILFSAKKVESINYSKDGNYVWNEYSFPEEIEAPYGCVLAIGYKGELKILVDGGNDEGYPDVKKSCYAFNYMEGFITRENWGNFFIRLSGSPIGVPQLAPEKSSQRGMFRCMPTDVNTNEKTIETIEPSVPVVKSVAEKAASEATGTVVYKVWRLKAGDKENKDAWVALNIEENKTLTYLDREFNSLPQGIYQYAVQVIYPEGQESNIRFSNELEHMMYTDVTFDITSNIGTDFADGTMITLQNQDAQDINYTVISAGSKVKFEQIVKGIYSLKATKSGFNGVTMASLDFTSQSAYFMGGSYPIIMDLMIKNPFNLKAEQKENSMDVTFRWNVEEGISEGFEDMEDFAVNPAGELGWTYVDVDGKNTYGVKACEGSPYPNMYAPMAFMAFNPAKTNPDLLDLLTPYSGDKILVDIAATEGEGANDDYLFSPALSFESDFVLNFYAKSGFFASMGNEEFMVGYCRETASPETVEWITAKPQAVGTAWTEFSYDIPKEAKFVTIRCVSNQRFFFMLDDIYVGYKQSFADQLAVYEVYLDEELVTKTNKSEALFPSLSKGRHLAKVQAVYSLTSGTKSYSDFMEMMFTVAETSGIETATQNMLYAYNVQSGVITFDDQVTKVAVYDVQGKLVTSSHESELNVSGWETGLYIFELKTNDQVSYCKIAVRPAR